MKKILFATLLFLVGCSQPELKIGENAHWEATLVTSMGEIRMKLFNDTPEHRDNFVFLAQKGFYDSLLFHRVIDGHVIQAGDPKSREAMPGVTYGGGGPGYDIPAEIQPHYFHRKGMVGTARKGDDVNPLKVSSGSQFYITMGIVHNDSTLRIASEEIERRHGHPLTPERIEVYKTVGGIPRLDGNYTLFAEVISGMDVAEKIVKVETASNDRPVENVYITNVKLEKVAGK